MINHPTMPAKAERHTLMFSATFPDAIQRLAASYLSDYLFLMVGVVGAASTDVTQAFVEVSHREKRDKLESVLRDIGGAKTLVRGRNTARTNCVLSFRTIDVCLVSPLSFRFELEWVYRLACCGQGCVLLGEKYV